MAIDVYAMTIQAIRMQWWEVVEYMLKQGVSPHAFEQDRRSKVHVLHLLALVHQWSLLELSIEKMPRTPYWSDIPYECTAVALAPMDVTMSDDAAASTSMQLQPG